MSDVTPTERLGRSRPAREAAAAAHARSYYGFKVSKRSATGRRCKEITLGMREPQSGTVSASGAVCCTITTESDENVAYEVTVSFPQYEAMGKWFAKNRNMGNSILPSGGAHVTAPMLLPDGTTMEVRPLPDLDKHALFHKHSRGESMIAMHPNGHSCKNLADRINKWMLGGCDLSHVLAQAKYILDCGGLCQHLDHFEHMK